MKVLMVFVAMFFGISLNAQTMYISNFFGNLPQPVSLADQGIEGNPYLSNEYRPAYVKIKNGYFEKNVPVKFNLYRNEVEFLKNDTAFILDSVSLMIYLEDQRDSSTMRIFKSGYPAIDGHSENSIYEVIVMGPKVHLLKYHEQKAEPIKTMGVYNKKELINYTKLYIYTPGLGIRKAKPDRKVLFELFPKYINQIDKIIKEKSLNPKNELHFAELLTDINSL